MQVRKNAYRKLKSATIALQCCLRQGFAKKIFAQLKHEQKDLGRLKENNEKLKMEMASLKAMLQAQAASDAGKVQSEKAIAEKQKEIDRLESRIKQLEVELANEKENAKKLENDLNVQRSSNQRLSQDLQYQKEMVSRAPSSPGGAVSQTHTRALSSAGVEDTMSKHTPEQSLLTLLSQPNQLLMPWLLDIPSLLKPWLCIARKLQGSKSSWTRSEELAVQQS